MYDHSIKVGYLDDVDIPSSFFKKSRTKVLYIDLPAERAIVRKRITNWVNGNAMDIFNDKELYILLCIENKIVNNTNDDELSCENGIVIIVVYKCLF